MSVKIPKTSVSQSDEQVIGAEADDSEPNNLPTSRISTAQLHLKSQIDVLNYGRFVRTKKSPDVAQEKDVELKEKKKKDDQNRAQKARDEKNKKNESFVGRESRTTHFSEC